MTPLVNFDKVCYVIPVVGTATVYIKHPECDGTLSLLVDDPTIVTPALYMGFTVDTTHLFVLSETSEGWTVQVYTHDTDEWSFKRAVALPTGDAPLVEYLYAMNRLFVCVTYTDVMTAYDVSVAGTQPATVDRRVTSVCESIRYATDNEEWQRKEMELQASAKEILVAKSKAQAKES